jgi:hypothetical protein
LRRLLETRPEPSLRSGDPSLAQEAAVSPSMRVAATAPIRPRRAHSLALGRLPALHLPYNPLSTARRKPGILVHVHLVLPRIAEASQPQLPRPGPGGQPNESSQLGQSLACSVRADFSTRLTLPRCMPRRGFCAPLAARDLANVLVRIVGLRAGRTGEFQRPQAAALFEPPNGRKGNAAEQVPRGSAVMQQAAAPSQRLLALALTALSFGFRYR